MRILAINSTDTGSTGNIAVKILEYAKSKGHSVCLACVAPKVTSVPVYDISCGKANRFFNHLIARVFGKDGFVSSRNTKHLISFITYFKPDIIHLHNLHDYYVNIKKLFNTIRSKRIKVVWTFHDCWAFTGKCPNFLHNRCDKWTKTCKHCPAKHEYPNSLVFNPTDRLLKIKRKIFSETDINIVCPSKWMQSNVLKSGIKYKTISQIYNGIDDLYFKKPVKKLEKNSNKIILSVAYPWTPHKGLDAILNYAKYKENDVSTKFVVVGIENVKSHLKNVEFLGRLQSNDLIELYDKATILLNPSKEESFGLTNIEAQSRGTPAIILQQSGGAIETVINKETGLIIDDSKPETMDDAFSYIITHRDSFSEKCKANANNFTINTMNKKYLDIYEQIFKTKKV